MMSEVENISRQLMIIMGILMFIIGILGNSLNICVFTKWSRQRTLANANSHVNDRTSNSALYLLVSSFANLLTITYSLTTRILFDGYHYRVTEENVLILCKIRYYTLHTSDLLSLTCICMATFDRYLISSRQARLRQMSTTREKTQFVIFILISLLALHSIPIAIYYTVSNDGLCVISSGIYLYYYRYTFQILLHGIIPTLFLSLFGFLTYRQLKVIQLRSNRNSRVNIDKQLSRMLVLLAITIVLSSVPYSIENIYYLVFADSTQQQNKYVFLAHVVSSILFYTNPVCNFYVYYISTPNFRSQVWKIICCKKNFVGVRNNQVHTIDVVN